MLQFTENRQRNIGLSVTSNPRTVLRSNGIVEATQAEAIAGTIQHRYISPLRLAQVIANEATGDLTRVNDTNVTLTLGGTPTDALWNDVSITVGWTGQLTVPRGGTGLSTVAQGDLLYGSAADTFSALTKNTTATRYLSNTGASNNPAWAQVDLSNGVAGDLPFANLTQGGAYTILLNNSGSMADVAAVAISSVTEKTALHNDDLFLISDSEASNAFKRVKKSNVATGGSGIVAGHIFGLKLSNNGTDPTNDIDITAGSCTDSTNTVSIAPSALTKRLDANWASGTNQGMRNSAAAITDTTYHIYAVSKAAGADPDFYAHTSTTVATVITALQAETGGGSYTLARRIGSIVRSSGAILTFVQDGDTFQLTAPTATINAGASLGTSAVTQALTGIPVGIRVKAFGTFGLNVDGTTAVVVSDLSISDLDPATFRNAMIMQTATGQLIAGQWTAFTDTSAQIRYRLSASGAAKFFYLQAWGWIDPRGRL